MKNDTQNSVNALKTYAQTVFPIIEHFLEKANYCPSHYEYDEWRSTLITIQHGLEILLEKDIQELTEEEEIKVDEANFLFIKCAKHMWY